MKFKFKLNTRAVVLITLIIAAIMFVSAFIELNQSKNEIFQLLNEHSSSLIESIIQSSHNTLNSSFEIEDLITEKLLDNARLIKKLDSLNVLTRDELIKIGIANNLYRINLFDSEGNRVLSNRIPEPDHIHGEENVNRFEEISPILQNDKDELIIGLKKAEFSDEERFAVAVSRAFNRGAIVVNLNAEEFLEFRKKIGIGRILQEMTKHHGIKYIVLQDSIGILAAGRQIDTIEAIANSSFLLTALKSDSVFSRIVQFSGDEVYEVVKRFVVDDEVIGIYRLGVTLEDIKNVEERMLRRLVIISIILAAVSIIVLSIIFTSQNLKTISEEYKKFKSLASSVLENMSESVIVVNNEMKIIMFNKSSEQLFNLQEDDVVGFSIFELDSNVLGLSEENFSVTGAKSYYHEKEIVKNNGRKFLLIGIKSISEDERNYIIVIKDLTEMKHLEDEARKNEKLLAMGELASGVAHEIRNPINAIAMIAHRLNQEFIPVYNKEEYGGIINVLRKEVERVNKIVTQFLSYAKPLEIKKANIDLKSFFEELRHLFEGQAKLRQIKFIIQSDDTSAFWFDADLIKQSVINIIRNAFDAVTENDSIILQYRNESGNLIIEVKDTGKGIPEEIQNRIFDLYFTTRKEGNGLGLSIVQKIISQHKGSITVTSKINKGTIFKITLPAQ